MNANELKTFLHHILILNVIGSNTIEISTRKLYGAYFHSISRHASIQYRIVSGKASHTEEQERIFNLIKDVTKQISNYHENHIIKNLLIRIQAEEEFNKSSGNKTSNMESLTEKVNKLATNNFNTVISNDIIKRFPRHWQTLLEQISDFLSAGKEVWWKKVENGIMFLDGSAEENEKNEGPFPHHFRNTTIPEEEKYLQQCWEECISNKELIPSGKINIFDNSGEYVDSFIVSTTDTKSEEMDLTIKEIHSGTMKKSPSRAEKQNKIDIQDPHVETKNSPSKYLNDAVPIIDFHMQQNHNLLPNMQASLPDNANATPKFPFASPKSRNINRNVLTSTPKPTTSLRTHFAIMLSKLFSKNNGNVIKIDKLRFQLKGKFKNDLFTIREYKVLLAYFEIELSKMKSNKLEELKRLDGCSIDKTKHIQAEIKDIETVTTYVKENQ